MLIEAQIVLYLTSGKLFKLMPNSFRHDLKMSLITPLFPCITSSKIILYISSPSCRIRCFSISLISYKVFQDTIWSPEICFVPGQSFFPNLFFKFYLFIFIQLQLPAFSPHPSTPPQPITLQIFLMNINTEWGKSKFTVII